MKRLIIIFTTMLILIFPTTAFAQSANMPVIDCSELTQKDAKMTVVDTRKQFIDNTENIKKRSLVKTVKYVFKGITGDIRQLIQRAAEFVNIDPHIIEAVAQAESGGNQAATSPKGAIGVMQLMPGTARSLGVNPYDTEQNIIGGSIYLKKQLEKFGDLPLALAAYNAGPGAVEEYQGIPPFKETRHYVANVLSIINRGGE